MRLTRASMMGMMVMGGGAPFIQAQEADLLPEMPSWIRAFTLRTGAGYKDNITLSPVLPEASPFLTAGLDGIFSRLPTGKTQFDLFFLFDHVQYLSSTSVDQEQLGFAQAQVKHDLSELWQTALALEYLYQDQVLDVSTTEADLRTTQVKGHGLILRPGSRLQVGALFWLSLEFPVNRQFFAEPLDDYWETGPKLILGKEYGHRSQITLSYESILRDYDTDEQVDLEGIPIAGTSKVLSIQEVQLNWQHYWDEQRRWRTSLRLGYRVNTDNGSGYFDFEKPHGALQLRYRSKPWDLSGRVRLAYYDYAAQTVGLADAAKRRRFETTYTLRGERRLAKFVSLFAEYEHERTQSNDPLEEYTVNRVQGGLSWEF